MSFAITGAAIAIVGGATQLIMASQGAKARRNEQMKAKKEMKQMKKEYQNLDTSNLAAGVRNPYQNLENTFEDLTVNQQQAQFEAQQFQQSQANIMESLSGAAGGSGIGALAQSLANQGIISAQKSSASIGMQEAQNQKAAAQQAANIQQMEGKGEMWAEGMRQQGAETARGLEWQKTATLFGMSQQRTAAANEAIRQAKADQMAAVGTMAQAGGQMAAAGMKKPSLPDGGTTTPPTNTATPPPKLYTMDPNQLQNQPITTSTFEDSMNLIPQNQMNITGSVGTDYTGGFWGGTTPSFLKKTDLKINKNK